MSNVYDAITSKIVKDLENGIIPWKKPWVGCQPMNYFRRQPYRGINKFILDGGEYVTEKELKYLKGSKIKEGVKPSYVAFYRMYEKVNPQTMKKEKVFFLRHYPVYNIADVENVKSKIPEKQHNPIEEAENILKNFKNIPNIKTNMNKAFYEAATDTIHIPELKHFESPEKYYVTLFKLLIHATGYESRLKRMNNIIDIKEYSKEDLIGQLGCAMLCGHAGIDTDFENPTTEEIKGWIEVLDRSDSIIIQAACTAQKAFDHIIGVE